MKKAQSAIEFMIMIGAVVFFFAIFMLAIQVNIGDKVRERKTLAVNDIAMTLQDEIKLATESIDGYSRSFSLPLTALNEDYDIGIYDGYVYVNTTNGKYAVSFPVFNVTGQPQPGDNIIRKSDGRVYLNN